MAEQAAKARGYSAGYAEGARRAEFELSEHRARLDAERATEREHMQQQTARAAEAVKAMLAAVDARLTPVVASVQSSLAAAAFELAEAVVGVELADDERSARSVVRRVTDSVEVAAVTTVRVNPDELALVAELVGEDQPLLLVGDATLGRSDAIAELPDGYLDATIASALDRARRALSAEER